MTEHGPSLRRICDQGRIRVPVGMLHYYPDNIWAKTWKIKSNAKLLCNAAQKGI